MNRFRQHTEEKTPEEKIAEKEELLKEMLEERNKYYKESVQSMTIDHFSTEKAMAKLASMTTKISFQQTAIDKIKKEDLGWNSDQIAKTRLARKRRH